MSTNPVTALTAPQSHQMALEPADMPGAFELCKLACASGMLPRAIQRPEQALMVLMRGRELGLTAMQSFASIHVIDGKTATSAELVVAMVKRCRALCQYFHFVSGDDKEATFETQRVDEPTPTRLTFTLAHAQALGLTGKDNWKRQPANMLRWRAATALARLVYPELTLGIYSNDEAEDAEDVVRAGSTIDVTPIVTQPIVEREPENEPLEAAAERWLDLFAEAVRTQDREPAERARREIKARVPTSDPRYGALVKSYKEALSIIGRKAQPAKQISVKGADGEVISGPPDREPGSDDE